MANSSFNPAQQQYIDWFTKKWIPGLLAGGATLGGLSGLNQIISSNLKPVPKPPDPVFINIPYRRPKEEEEAVNKLAGFSSYMLGGSAKEPADIPLAWPATLFGGVGAGLLGYGGAKKLVDIFKNKIHEDQTDAAKEEYQKALLAQFKPLPAERVVKANNGLTKLAYIQALITKSAKPATQLARVADKLDKLADKILEKKALFGGWPEYLLNRGTGIYSTLFPMAALASGLAVNHYMKNNDPVRARTEALEEQQEKLLAQRPAETFARLVPVDEQGNKVPPQANKKPKVKMAGVVDAAAAKFVKELLGA